MAEHYQDGLEADVLTREWEDQMDAAERERVFRKLDELSTQITDLRVAMAAELGALKTHIASYPAMCPFKGQLDRIPDLIETLEQVEDRMRDIELAAAAAGSATGAKSGAITGGGVGTGVSIVVLTIYKIGEGMGWW